MRDAKLLRWGISRLGQQRVLALLLLVVVMASVALTLADLVRELDLLLMLALAAVSLLVGWGLASSPWRGRAASVVIVVSGLVVLFLRVGQLGGKLVAVPQALIGLLWGFMDWLLAWDILHEWPSVLVLDWAPLAAALTDLWSSVVTLLFRVWTWGQALLAGRSAFDPVATTMVWGFTIWIVGAWAGWVVRRSHKPLRGVTPAGVLIAVVLSYSRNEPYALLVLLGATLLLLALMAYDTILRRWRSTGTDFPDLVGGEVAVAAVLLTFVLLLTAWGAAQISLQNIVDFVQDLGIGQDADAVGNSLGVGRGPGEGVRHVSDDEGTDSLPRSHRLGAGRELGEGVVLVVSTGELPSGLDLDLLDMMGLKVPRYYWRSVTYDRYSLRGWYTSARGTFDVEYAAGEPAIAEGLTATHKMVQQNVRVIGDTGGVVYATGTLAAVDQDYVVSWRSHGDVFGATTAAETYQAESWLSTATLEQLRSAGEDYPEWVVARYLTLPDTVPDRVLSLARDLTATAPTPYDRARAIEVHLRRIPYTLKAPEPPLDRDAADYFLFDLQEGHCDYYATAMVVLARAAGVPARYVSGYTTGTYDPRAAYYVVTEADAHAWVEVYFPGYGWVEFEPTAGVPPINRPAEIGSHEWLDDEESTESTGPKWWDVTAWPWWQVVAGVLALLVLGGRTWSAADNWWLRRQKPAATVSALYGRLRRRGQGLVVPMQAGDTPYECAASFAGWATGLAQEKRWAEILLPAVYEVHRLVDLYVQAIYTTQPLSVMDQVRAMRSWRMVRWRLWLARVWLRKPLRDSRRKRAAV